MGAVWPHGAGTGALLGMLREILSQIASPSSQLDRDMLDDMLVHLPLLPVSSIPPTHQRLPLSLASCLGGGQGAHALSAQVCDPCTRTTCANANAATVRLALWGPRWHGARVQGSPGFFSAVVPSASPPLPPLPPSPPPPSPCWFQVAPLEPSRGIDGSSAHAERSRAAPLDCSYY